MDGKRRFALLIVIMAGIMIGIGAIMLFALYRASFEQQRERLVETAKSRARLIEAVGRFGAQYGAHHLPEGPFAATIAQVRDAHERFTGFGKSGEFTLARREGDQIVFLLSQRHYELQDPPPVPLSSKLAEPMRRALSGESGTVIGLDYRGALVLAAHEPVAELNLGIVAKIDLAEVRAPFIRAGLLAAAGASVLIILGTLLFLKVGSPIIQRLEENEKKYRGIFESAADMLFLADSHATILDVNPAACLSHGFSKEELLGRRMSYIICPEDGSLVDRTIEKVCRGETFLMESRHLRKDGTAFLVEVRVSPTLHRGQTVALAAVRDITDRKQAEDQLRFQAELLDNVRESVVATDLEGHIIYWGKGAEALYGYSAEEVLGESVTFIVKTQEAEEEKERMRTVLETGIWSGQYLQRRKDGSSFWAETVIALVKDQDGEPFGLIGIDRDITESRLAEDALRASESRYRRLSESLEQLVRQKVAQLRQAESMAAIGRMVSIVAHEVRNPLQNIQMGVDTMQNEIGDDPEQREILEEINYGVTMLNGIIEELLKYSKPVNLKCSSAPLKDVVGKALKTLDHRLDNVDIRLELEDENRNIVVDVPKISSVLVNLLSNAIEAMPAGGTLRLSSRFHDNGRISALRLAITDSGYGIDEKDLDKIHQPFFTTKTKGVGLGIPACKKIIEAHNGILVISSERNKGTTVEIELPTECPDEIA